MLVQDISIPVINVQNRDYEQELQDYVQHLYGDIPITPCPFTKAEIEALEEQNELLVYLPAKMTMKQLCQQFGIRANVDFDNESLIKNTMVSENQWFIASASKTPELMYQTGLAAKRIYEDEGLHGMDFRRYLAFAATFKYKFGVFPDQTYWTFLVSGSYDRSGISIVGFDARGVLNHHGWMRNFKAKFLGSRYIVIAPRLEVVPETETLPRAQRGRRGTAGKEADME
ncbi:hypothetical protein B6N60_00735 [Richelia sinica FACHB-800]|uniref:Uncharacterized protein n=1 Tax=Richelia sinica FACHB-800 TaxID=1357546 RepID=A0A975T508_9NOST|nr:hypothetical protein [Richelia sinica]MBD2663178.1 hypothetical protein [Richelia sinica FACHB-800]QXE22055.1 hypothetical protein B6N60_00735 [Richelia sinica FACHB-800]